MIPQNVSRQRNVVKWILWLLCASWFALALIMPARTENALATPAQGRVMTKGYCASDLDQPVIYVSNIFDVRVAGSYTTQPVENGHS
jgi:hypothetical protein